MRLLGRWVGVLSNNGASARLLHRIETDSKSIESVPNLCPKRHNGPSRNRMEPHSRVRQVTVNAAFRRCNGLALRDSKSAEG